MDFINRIVLLMKENNITQKKLAQDLGISASSITNWIKGKIKNPSAETVARIAKYFDVTPDFLLGDEANDPICANADTIVIEERIKVMAKERGMTVDFVLKEAEVNSNFMTPLRSGSFPRADAIVRIADALDCSVDFLLGRDGEAAKLSPFMCQGQHEWEMVEAYRGLPDKWKEIFCRQALALAASYHEEGKGAEPNEKRH